MKLRPNAPKVFDITPDGYHEHNRYFNEAEKIFDKLEKAFYPKGYEECAICRDCGRIVHDYHIPNEIWNDVITGSPIIYLSDGITPSRGGRGACGAMTVSAKKQAKRDILQFSTASWHTPKNQSSRRTAKNHDSQKPFRNANKAHCAAPVQGGLLCKLLML